MMKAHFKEIQKETIFQTTVFKAIFQIVDENTKKKIQMLDLESLRKIIQIVYNKLSIQKDII